jgi:hypothetical protein
MRLCFFPGGGEIRPSFGGGHHGDCVAGRGHRARTRPPLQRGAGDITTPRLFSFSAHVRRVPIALFFVFLYFILNTSSNPPE